MTSSKPIVSIVMPVFNEEQFVSQAIDSLLQQDFEDFELIISDNASTDRTFEICVEYKNKDQRIKLHRNERNLGTANFKQIVNLSSGKYLMAAAGHDLWSPNFISRCIDVLESDSKVVLAYTRAMRIDCQGDSLELVFDQIDTRGMSVVERVSCFMRKIGAHAHMFYGVIKAQALKQIKFKSVWAADIPVLVELAIKGAFAYIPETLFYWRKVRDESIEEQKKRSSLAIDPVNSDRRFNMGIPELWRETKNTCLAAINQTPLSHRDKMILKSETKRYFKAWELLTCGALYYEQRKYDNAEEKYKEYLCMEEALSLKLPDKNIKADILFSLGNIYLQQQRFKEAEEKFKEVLLQEPQDKSIVILIYYTMGSLCKKEGMLEEAKEKYKSVLELVSDSSVNRKRFAGGAHFHLGCIHKELGEHEKARKHFEKCLEFIPDHRKAREKLEEIQNEYA